MNKTLNLMNNEQEALKELLDEEIEEVEQSIDCQDDYNRINPYIDNLKKIRAKLNDNTISLEIKLGFEIGKLSDYEFKEIYNVISKKETTTFFVDKLFNLYDEFGYSVVNDAILKLGKQNLEVQENE